MNVPIERIQHSLLQGTPEWNAFRLNHFGASEAAAMLGLSKKVKRSELLRMKYTGIAKEFSDWVQKHVLDHGHAVEELARPLVEEIIGEPLYPVTFSMGKLSASCDGLTIGDDVAFEHKQWNESLAASIRNGILPEEHMPQAQQVMLVTGAVRLVFVCSDGTKEKFVSMDVLPDRDWFAKIEAGWAQFEKDLADYVPPAPEQIVVAAPQAQLPAVMVRVDGALTVTDNLKEFGEQLSAYVATLNFNPQTDQDFADLEAAVKLLKRAEEEIDEREAGAMAQIEAVNRLRQIAASVREAARQPRLRGEKVVKSGKDDRKTALITTTLQAFVKHVAVLQAEISTVRFSPPVPGFAEAIKGLKTLSSIQDRLDSVLANGKAEAEADAKDIRDKLAWFNGAADGYKSLFDGSLNTLVAKPLDDFKLAVISQIEQQQKQEAETRERIRKEESEKLLALQQSSSLVSPSIVQPAPQVGSDGYTASSPTQTRTTRFVGLVRQGESYRSQAPTLRLGKINERLAPITLTADGLESLGFPHAATEKSAKLYHECDFLHICVALQGHIQAAADAINDPERNDMAKPTTPAPYTEDPYIPIAMTPVTSNQVKAIGYDEATNTLAVTFTRGNGAIYHYPNVAHELYSEFICAKSIGKFFGERIKPLPFKKFMAEKEAA